MSDYEQIALHFYNEIAPQVVGKVGVSFQRQHRDILNNLEATIERFGAEVASNQLRAVANYSQVYDGRNHPSMMDVFNSMHEMSEAGIQPDTMEWREQITAMSDRNLIRTATVNEDGETKIFENAAQNLELEAADPLNEALQYQKQQLKYAMSDGDEHAASRIERTIGLIERDIQKLNPESVPKSPVPNKPALSPEAKSRQQEEDKEFYDSLARHDSTPDADEADDFEQDAA